MYNTICLYFILFIIYAVMGWIMEVTCQFIDKHKFINRGFLIGPYCPIYGYGCLLIILLLKRYLDDPVVLFCMSIVICSLLEYLTSYFLEKIFHARWWDYSDKRYNINGRICLETMIPFGILGTFIMYVVNPFFVSILVGISPYVLNIIATVIFVIFALDNVISLSVMFGFRNTITAAEKDYTEEISKKVRDVLLKKGYFYKRLVKAFPNFNGLKEIKKRLEEYRW